jgi:immune inhibitor A
LIEDLASRPGVTSIVPPPAEVVEKLYAEGQTLPPLHQFKAASTPMPPRPMQGNINLLVIMVDFTDNAATVTNLTVFDNLVFAAPVAGRGSVRDYFDEVTYGQVTIATVNLPSTTGWQGAPQTYAYYVNGQYGWGGYPQNAGRMVEDLIPMVDPLVDFSNYDNDGDGWVDTLLVIHAGTGAEFSTSVNDIWSHASSISLMGGTAQQWDGVWVDNYVTTPEFLDPSMVGPNATDMTIGVMCHEIGHGLWGLPDLYDLDLTSWGIGQWGLMSYGDWNGPAKWNPFIGQSVTDGSSPAWPTAWSRLLMGVDTYFQVLGPMETCLAPVENNQGAILRFKSSGLRSDESFLAENRQQLPGQGMYDEFLPGSGMLIWHVDEAEWSIYGGPDNNTECTNIPHCGGPCWASHYLVALEQADGNDDLEFLNNRGDAGDPFPGTTSNTAWEWYGNNPTNPESGTWYDNGCAIDSCIDVDGIYVSPPNVCISIQQAYCSETEADLGDAPASQNNYGNTPMTAYPFGGPPGVQANYPTVFFWGMANTGPRHHFCTIDSVLGNSVTGELQADWLPDQDGVTNIDPPSDIPDQDSHALTPGDDGVPEPVPLAHCVGVNLQFTATVFYAPLYGPVLRYFNVWFDWNGDGDWADTPTCPGGLPAPEWAVQDDWRFLNPGTHQMSTLPFAPKINIVEDAPFETWMRISIAEMTAPSPQDGRGPPQGYDVGETEDYFLFLEPWLEKTADLPEDPAPGEMVTYEIAYQGFGNVIATDAVISDVLPLGVEYVSSDPPGNYDAGTRTITWSISLEPELLETVDLVVQVTGQPSDTVTNTAYLLWANTIWKRADFGFHVGEGGCNPGDPHADFSASEPACSGQAVAFTNMSSGTLPLAYAWDFDGDGVVDSTAEHPNWTYNTAGAYQAILTVTNVCGQSVYSDVVTVLQTLEGLDIAGPAGLLIGEEGLYTALPTPPDAEDPLYQWDNGTAGITATYSWDTPGSYTIVLTGSNDCALLTATLDVLVTAECVSLTGVTVDGPPVLLIGEEGTYLASPEPLTATNPSYQWDNGSTGPTAVYSWTTPGTYDVLVTATNCGATAVTGTMRVFVSAECISLTGVAITGPVSLEAGEEGTYLASPIPLTATHPSYLWSNGAAAASAVYSWTVPGTYTVAVTATNCQTVVVNNSLEVVVTGTVEFQIYLPLVLRND